MKTFAIACLLAVPLTAALESPARAWCKFGCGCNLSLGGRKCAWDGGQPPCEKTTTTLTPSCAAPFWAGGPRPPVPAPGAAPAHGGDRKAAVDAATGVQPIYYQAQNPASGEMVQQPVGYYYWQGEGGYYYVPVYGQGN